MEWEINTYGSLVQDVLDNGNIKNSRIGKTKSVFGRSFKLVPNQDGFPIIQGRRMYIKGILAELAAFLDSPKHINDFKKYGCNYWDSWAKEDGSINLDYGNTWRDFNGVDQLSNLIDSLKNNPDSRRHIVTGWRPETIPNLDLPCCHMLYQWYVNDDKLDMIWYQRSVDLMVGLPSNMVSATLLNLLVARTVGLKLGTITMMLGDVHIYKEHMQNAREYLRVLQDVITNEKWIFYYKTNYYLDTLASVNNFHPSMFELGEYFYQSNLTFELKT